MRQVDSKRIIKVSIGYRSKPSVFGIQGSDKDKYRPTAFGLV